MTNLIIIREKYINRNIHIAHCIIPQSVSYIFEINIKKNRKITNCSELVIINDKPSRECYIKTKCSTTKITV